MENKVNLSSSKRLRKTWRFKRYLAVKFVYNDIKYSAFACDIGGGGLRLETKIQMPIDIVIDIEVILPNRQVFAFKGKTLRVEERAGKNYYGIQFTNVSASRQDTMLKILFETYAKK